jgi:hypothetical protein
MAVPHSLFLPPKNDKVSEEPRWVEHDLLQYILNAILGLLG